MHPIMRINFIAAFLALAFSSETQAQTGDRAGEKQSAQIPADKIPPAPPLAPAEALKRFKVPDEFAIQLVASEPMVVNPVMVRWDASGRLWVLEMRSFMPNSAGEDEVQAVSQVAILHDDDGDGRMDRKTVFIDNLVMPRAMAFTRNGVLICEPPELHYYPILAGDKPGNRITIDPEYAPHAAPVDGKMNVEHAANGLVRGLDNWFYNAKSTSRYRHLDDEWKKESTYFKGQWGISQDNYGRLAFNSNSDHFRLEPIPSNYLQRNPFHRGATYSIQPLPNQTVWPGRMNPGVNRAYKPGFLRPNGTIKGFTGASSIAIYRGAHFPENFIGDAFVPEPCGNLLRRDDVTERSGVITAVNPYAKQQTEFLTSTDEIFRPVNAHMGPDGALYLVDMYHGIIQHHAHLTTYLRKQSESRGLDKVTDFGRIYRIVHRTRAMDTGPDLAKASPEVLVKTLDHANGWFRDTAQRLIVDSQPSTAVAPLKRLALTGKTHLGRLHALWTLEGLGYLDLELLAKVLKQERDGKVLAGAIRLCEPILKSWEQEDALNEILKHSNSTDADVKLQLALTLSGFSHARATKVLITLATANADHRGIRDAILSGMPGREGAFAAGLIRHDTFRNQTGNRAKLLGDLARCVITQGRREPVNLLLEIIRQSETPIWQKTAVITGMTPPKVPPTEGLPAVPRKRIRLTEKPAALASLLKVEDPTFTKALHELDKTLIWPGKPGVVPEPPVRRLNRIQQIHFDSGNYSYDMSCGNCHRPHGFGMPGLAPPLAGSEWVAASPEQLVRIVLHGMTGPVTVLGKRYNMNMPGHQAFSDEEVAGILTYIRRAWDHNYDPVSPHEVAAIRKQTENHEHAWTAAELLQIGK
jgi:mono/diheme cytochrome c family protein